MLNRCEFIGNLGADPEVRSLGNGGKVVNLKLAVSEKWTDKATGERKERTEWIAVVIFNEKLCEVAQRYLKKGSKAFIAGAMQTRRWQDNSGNDRYSTEIVLQNYRGELTLLDSPSGDRGNGGGSAPQTKGRPSFDDDLDDSEVPF